VKKTISMLLALTMYLPLSASKAVQTVNVEVASQAESRAVKHENPGLIGAIQGVRTTDVVFMVNVIINGEHARLKCYENHRGCTNIGPGNYKGEMEKDNVWISMEVPLTHQIVRDHWKVSGTW
jgi:hypothetical protein